MFYDRHLRCLLTHGCEMVFGANVLCEVASCDGFSTGAIHLVLFPLFRLSAFFIIGAMTCTTIQTEWILHVLDDVGLFSLSELFPGLTWEVLNE